MAQILKEQEHKEIDPLTGTATTGHDWDGIHELNTPLPRWWLWTFYATIIWAIGYWVVYPAWPLLTSATQGAFGWHSRSAVVADIDQLKLLRGPMMVKLTKAPIAEIEADPQLLDFARALGRAAFADNCAPCHGAGGGGAKGLANSLAARFPNKADADAELHRIAAAWAEVFDANSLFILGRAMETYDVASRFDRIKVPVLYVLSRTDALFPPSLAPGVMEGLKAAGVDATYFEIDSDHGHLASGADADKWAPALRAFMTKLESA